MKRFVARLFGEGEETGSALAEFAITLPALLMLMTYSVFFTDLVEVKLQTLELARYAAWEKTVHRPTADIAVDAKARWANMRSYDKGDSASRTHMIGIQNVQINVTVDDAKDVIMTGTAPPGSMPSDPSGFLGAIDDGVDWVLNVGKLNTKGKARADVSITVDNKIVPKVMLMNRQVRDDRLENSFEFKNHHVLVYDTWKAWPNPNNQAGQTNRNADPMQTYTVAEKVVASQERYIAFLSLNRFDIVDDIQKFMSDFGLPEPLPTREFATNEGPTTMRGGPPGDAESFSPTAGRSDATRLGHRTGATQFYHDNVTWGIDRSRFSFPNKVNTDHWYQQNGGKKHKPLKPEQKENEYYQTWQCRGHYYEGMVDAEGQYGDRNAYNGCGDSVDDWMSENGSWLDNLLNFDLGSMVGGSLGF